MSEEKSDEKETEKEETKDQLPRPEVIRRLRERNQPIRTFGESDVDALKRLRKLEVEAPELKEGYRNDFKAAMDRVDQEYLNEIIQGKQNEEGRHDVKVDSTILTIDDIHVINLLLFNRERKEESKEGTKVLNGYRKWQRN